MLNSSVDGPAIHPHSADRLWIQRSTHQPRSLKRKRFPKQPTKENHKPAGKRRKVRRDDSSDSSSNLPDPQPREIAISGPRAAKLKANKKLDAQARALAKFQRENALVIRSMRTTRRAGSVKDPGSSHPRVMRASGRLRRGKPDPDDEWESIPDGWMTEDNSGPSPRISTRTTKLRRMSPETTDLESDHEDPKPIKTGLESDESVSDLTDLSSDHEDSVSTDVNGGWNKCDSDTLTDGKQDDAMPNHNLAEFIEWEMVGSLALSLLTRVVLTEARRSAQPFQSGKTSPNGSKTPPTTPRKRSTNSSRTILYLLLWRIYGWVNPTVYTFCC